MRPTSRGAQLSALRQRVVPEGCSLPPAGGAGPDPAFRSPTVPGEAGGSPSPAGSRKLSLPRLPASAG